MTDDKKRQGDVDQSTSQEYQGEKGGTSEAAQDQTEIDQETVSEDSTTTLDIESGEEVEESDTPTNSSI